MCLCEGKSSVRFGDIRMQISGKLLLVFLEGQPNYSYEIEFCPSCGKKLDDLTILPTNNKEGKLN